MAPKFLLPLSVALLQLGCSKPEPPPTRTEPWPAQSSSARGQLAATGPWEWWIEPRGEGSFVLEAPKRTLRGRVRVVRGELQLDPQNLMGLRGRIALDLGSLVVEGADGEDDRAESSHAQNWLDIGASRPVTERERARWAEFRIQRVVEATPKSAHEGRLTQGTAGLVSAGTVGEGQGDSAEKPQGRKAEVTAEGTLELHGYRIARRVRLALIFHYPDPPSRDSTGSRANAQDQESGAVPEFFGPDALELTTVSPVPVILAEHDIVPRDTLGTLISAELPRLGVEFGKVAKVQVHLFAHPKPSRANPTRRDPALSKPGPQNPTAPGAGVSTKSAP